MNMGELALKIMPDPEPVLVVLRREAVDLREPVRLLVTPNVPGVTGGRRIVQQRWTPELTAQYWRMFSLRHTPWERRLTDVIRTHLRVVRDGVIERLYRYAPQVRGLYAGWSCRKVLAHVDSKTDGPADKINIDPAEEAAELKAILTPYLQALMAEQGTVTMQELGLGTVWNTNDKRVLKELGRRMDKFSREVAGTTFDAIKSVLREDFSQGLPAPVTADKLRQTFDAWERWRAPLIARTETTAGMNIAQLLAIEQAGLEHMMLKHWLCAGDEATRPTHAEAHARYAEHGIELGALFQIGADTMLCPGQGNLAEENVNCRCAMRMSVREVPGQIEIIATTPATQAREPQAEAIAGAAARAKRKPRRKATHARPIELPDKEFGQRFASNLHDQMLRVAEGANPDIVGQKIVVQERLTERVLQLSEPDRKAFDALVDELAVKLRNVHPWGTASEVDRIRYAIRELVHNWAITSGDDNSLAVALQQAAKAEFKLSRARLWWWRRTQNEAKQEWGHVSAGLRVFLRLMYEDTQSFFAEKGIRHLYLWRGMSTTRQIHGLPYDRTTKAAEVLLQPMSSFSCSFNTARKFSDDDPYRKILFAKVPVERCIGSYRSGFGCMDETEIVVLGPAAQTADTVYAYTYTGLRPSWEEVSAQVQEEIARQVD